MQEAARNISDPMKQSRISSPLAWGLSVLAGIVRLVPHIWHMTPVGALGLYGGARLGTFSSFALPIGLMVASDALLAWMHQDQRYLFHALTPFVYGSFLLNVVIGRFLTRTSSPLKIGSAALVGSIQFFLITNFGVWLVMGVDASTSGTLIVGQYRHNLAGLIECYAMAWPFYKGTLLGDLLYTGVLFGLHATFARLLLKKEQVEVRKLDN